MSKHYLDFVPFAGDLDVALVKTIVLDMQSRNESDERIIDQLLSISGVADPGASRPAIHSRNAAVGLQQTQQPPIRSSPAQQVTTDGTTRVVEERLTNFAAPAGDVGLNAQDRRHDRPAEPADRSQKVIRELAGPPSGLSPAEECAGVLDVRNARAEQLRREIEERMCEQNPGGEFVEAPSEYHQTEEPPAAIRTSGKSKKENCDGDGRQSGWINWLLGKKSMRDESAENKPVVSISPQEPSPLPTASAHSKNSRDNDDLTRIVEGSRMEDRTVTSNTERTRETDFVFDAPKDGGDFEDVLSTFMGTDASAKLPVVRSEIPFPRERLFAPKFESEADSDFKDLLSKFLDKK